MQDKKKTVAIDVDDVLAASADGFVAWSNETFGTNLTTHDYQEHWADMWRVDHAEVSRRADLYHASGYHEKFAPIDDAYDVLQALKEQFRLIVITSRRTSGSSVTLRWLETHYAGIFEDVIYSGFYDAITEKSFALTKGDIAKRAGVDFLVDDQVKHVIAAAEAGIPAVLFGDYPWNKSDALPARVTRAHDWKAVLQYFRNTIH